MSVDQPQDLDLRRPKVVSEQHLKRKPSVSSAKCATITSNTQSLITWEWLIRDAEDLQGVKVTTVAETTVAVGQETAVTVEWEVQVGTWCVRSAETITSRRLHLHQLQRLLLLCHHHLHNSSNRMPSILLVLISTKMEVMLTWLELHFEMLQFAFLIVTMISSNFSNNSYSDYNRRKWNNGRNRSR